MGLFEAYQKILDGHSPNPELESRMEKALKGVQSGDWLESLQQLEDISLLADYRLDYVLGTELIKLRESLKKGRKEAMQLAVDCYSRAVTANAGMSDAWLMKGYAHAFVSGELRMEIAQSGQLFEYALLRFHFQEALKAWAKAAELNPGFKELIEGIRPGVQQALDKLEIQFGKWRAEFGSSEQEIDWITEMSGGGMKLLQEGKWEDALKYFDAVEDQEHYLTLYGKALSRLQINRGAPAPDGLDEIFTLFKAVSEARPEWPDPHFFRGITHYHAAEVLFMEEIRSDGESADNEAMLQHNLDALDCFREAIRLNPNLEEKALPHIEKASERVAILTAMLKQGEQEMKIGDN